MARGEYILDMQIVNFYNLRTNEAFCGRRTKIAVPIRHPEIEDHYGIADYFN
jgi:rRNA maturation protein Nop10